MPKPRMSADQVMERMAKTYANCETYCDSGIVRTVFSEQHIVERPFTTAFVRPGQFRFEFKEREHSHRGYRDCFQHIVWCREDEVRTWFSYQVPDRLRQPESLGLALAGATGISGGSAHIIPSLLIPDEVGGRRFSEMANAKRVEDDELSGDECFRVQGDVAASSNTLWIAKHTFLVRRIDEQMQIKGNTVHTTFSYEPVVNASVASELLEFNPPKPRPRRLDQRSLYQLYGQWLRQ